MDLRKLRHAAALAREGSFTRASEVLHLTQSALSRSVQSLEDGLGVTLFERHGSGVRLTMEGQTLLPQAERVLRDARALEQDARLLQTGQAGRLCFGVGPMLAPIIAPVLAEFVRQAPSCSIRAEIAPIPKMIEAVLDGGLEFFISDTSQSQTYAELHVEVLNQLSVGFYVRANHPLAYHGPVRVTELAAYALASPFIQTEDGANNQNGITTMGWAGHISCEDAVSLKNIALNSDTVLFGMGPALQPELSNGGLISLSIAGYPPRKSNIGITCLAQRTLSPLATKIIATARQELLAL